MKRYFSLIVGCLVALLAVSAAAQTTQIATLLSGEDVRIFYGPESLKQAVTAAQDGDVITLSAGLFDAPSTLDKSLIIRGAGIELSNYKQEAAPTIISGALSVDADSQFEGIQFRSSVTLNATASSVTFLRARLAALYCNISNNIKIIQSYISEFRPKKSTVTALNSIFGNCYETTESKFHGIFTNCYIKWSGCLGNGEFHNSSFMNCILYNTDTGNSYISDTSQAFNCIAISRSSKKTILPAIGHETCLDLKNIDVFKEGTFYELLDEYKSFATSDGKEVGIYGGNLGFDITPSNPQITRFNVAPKTSVDGKLSIEIEVQGIE